MLLYLIARKAHYTETGHQAKWNVFIEIDKSDLYKLQEYSENQLVISC